MKAGERCYVERCGAKAVHEVAIVLKKSGATIARVRLCASPACIRHAQEALANTVELRGIDAAG